MVTLRGQAIAEPRDAVTLADEQLYGAKAAGRNRVAALEMATE